MFYSLISVYILYMEKKSFSSDYILNGRTVLGSQSEQRLLEYISLKGTVTTVEASNKTKKFDFLDFFLFTLMKLPPTKENMQVCLSFFVLVYLTGADLAGQSLFIITHFIGIW